MAEALRGRAGGISGLRRLLREHGEAVEADLRRVYGIRLRELFTGGMTWRELGVYVRGLPPESAARTAMNGNLPEPTQESLLLADVIDAVQWVRWQIAAQNVDKESKLPKPPRPYPRWWDPKRGGKKKDSPERVARIEDARRRAAERKRQIATGQIA